MIVISGNTLGERQRDLNSKVAEAVAIKKDFSIIKTEQDTSDVEKFYKIDIATHYRDINYITEVLKTGDSLCISRVLKCPWLYHDDYSYIVDTENLHTNIFPYMSIKMKKKMLSAISMHIRNEDRASTFFLYCQQNKMLHIAFKFLNFTSEDFKLRVLMNEWTSFASYLDSKTKLLNFIGNSFALAEAWLKSFEWLHDNAVDNLSFLYFVDNNIYFDMIEKYVSIDANKLQCIKRLGIKISRDIMIKHKDKVLLKPFLYINKLNKKIIAKYSTSHDAKMYMIELLPNKVEEFWDIQYFELYDFIIDLIPVNEKFEFLKNIFISKYPGELFEMSHRFFQSRYYKVMTAEEKEVWALRHLADNKEYLGKGNDYVLYQFVHFDKAFFELKKCIMTSPDSYRRADVIDVLLDAVQNQNDLTTVLNYYYDRHVNETEDMKNRFIDKVLNDHKVFEFNDESWEALNKLFNSLGIYVAGRNFSNQTYTAVAVACHILHNQPMPQALVDFIDLDINYNYFSYILDKMTQEKSEIVLQYLIKLFVDKLQPLEQDPHNKKLRKKLKKYVNNIFTLLSTFRKDDNECPEIARKFIEIDSPSQKELKKITEKDIFRFLKTDVKLAIDVLLHFENHINDWPERLNNVLRKLKVYFPNDVAPQYLNFLNRWLSMSPADYQSIKVINAAIFGIFQLADEDFKVALMEKYHPIGTKIDYNDIKLRYTQEAICRFVGYSRPPVPLGNVLKYVKGDYVQFCLPLFNMYLVNLPLLRAIEFTEAIINAPVSVQKHGIRLAFNCYSSEHLKSLILNAWNKTKNVSLRKIIYKSLFDKITACNDDTVTQAELYEVLKLLTLDLHEDEDDLFNLINSNRMSNKFIGDYLRTGWDMVTKLPDKLSNMRKQKDIILSIEKNIKFVKKDYIRTYIIDKHISESIENKRLRPYDSSELEILNVAKWELTASYIVQYSNDVELQDSLSLVSLIFLKCLNMWNDVYKDSLVYQKFFFNFISMIKNKSIVWSINSWDIFEHIIVILKEALPMKEIYLTIWELQIAIYARIATYRDAAMSESDYESKQFSGDEIELISTKFGNCVIQFVQELLLKNQFYPIFYPAIAEFLKQELCRISFNLNTNDCKFKLGFGESLVNAGIKETHLLTLMILPSCVPDEYKDDHTRILKSIQAYEDAEVQTFLYSTTAAVNYIRC